MSLERETEPPALPDARRSPASDRRRRPLARQRVGVLLEAARRRGDAAPARRLRAVQRDRARCPARGVRPRRRWCPVPLVPIGRVDQRRRPRTHARHPRRAAQRGTGAVVRRSRTRSVRWRRGRSNTTSSATYAWLPCSNATEVEAGGRLAWSTMPATELDQVVNLCKRRGFVFPSSDIYGGLNGFWDYGPLGVEFKRNVKDAWWRDMVTAHDELQAPAGAPDRHDGPRRPARRSGSVGPLRSISPT